MSEKKYAKIIDEETYQVQIGAGCTDEYYEEIGMTEMEVEQAYNGLWYVAGHAPAIPEPTPEEIKQLCIAELKQQLNNTDYVVIKIAEAETIEEQNMLREHYSDIIVNRKHWREEINSLEQ